MVELKIETYGKILNGEYRNWYIFIQDDQKNTGGYLILLSSSLEPTDKQGFDLWMENYQDLIECFRESKWNVKWL